jgi:hypothetical protein
MRKHYTRGARSDTSIMAMLESIARRRPGPRRSRDRLAWGPPTSGGSSAEPMAQVARGLLAKRQVLENKLVAEPAERSEDIKAG